MTPFKCLPLAALLLTPSVISAASIDSPRERISLDAGWRFYKGETPDVGTNLTYPALRAWLLPARNSFTANPSAPRPSVNPAENISFAGINFDDSQWRLLNLPHDWGVEGPFQLDYPGETGKLPWWGIAWYRHHLDVPNSDAGKKIYLDVDGAMSYATVWVSGKLVGGWPYGYASWRVDLTPYLNFGGDNVLAIRLDNPPDSSRWYPGGGIYRNVWLVKTAPVHLAHWGTFVTTPEVNASAATIKCQVNLDNDSDAAAVVLLKNEIFEDLRSGRQQRQIHRRVKH